MQSIQQRRKRIANGLIIFILLLISVLNICIFIFSSTAFYNETIFSLAMRATLVFGVLVFFLYLMMQDKITLSFFLLFCIIICAFISYLLNPTKLEDAFISIGGYIMLPVYATVIPKLSIRKKKIKLLRALSVIIAFLFIYLGLVVPVYREGSDALSMGYSNPNRTAMYLMLTIIFILIAFENTQHRKIKFFSWALILFLIYVMFLTQSRTALLISILICLYAILPRVPKITKKFSVFCLVFTVFFSRLYVYIYEKGFWNDVEILGKPIFSGREETFLIEQLPLNAFGYFSTGEFGGLNIFVGLTNTLGLVGFVLFFLFYLKFLTSPFLFRENGKNLIAFIFAVLFLHGCTETAIFLHGSVYAGMLACVLLAANLNQKEVAADSDAPCPKLITTAEETGGNPCSD